MGGIYGLPENISVPKVWVNNWVKLQEMTLIRIDYNGDAETALENLLVEWFETWYMAYTYENIL